LGLLKSVRSGKLPGRTFFVLRKQFPEIIEGIEFIEIIGDLNNLENIDNVDLTAERLSDPVAD
jgi:hypothetical protein